MPRSLSNNSSSCFDLLCSEDADVLADEPDYSTTVVFPDDSDESIAEFLEGEADYSPGFDYPERFRSRSLDPCAREEAVAWILKVYLYYRFQPLTAYLAVNYFDRFLSAHQLPEAKSWALQLLSVACLSLATKMEETLPPSLLDLQEDARFIFEPRTIGKMELLVLSTLQWRLRSVTPFTFIDFFAYKVDPSGIYTRCLVSQATQIILSTIHDTEFLDHCPSSMAAAAILCAADGTSDLPLINPGSAMAWCIGLTKEGITNCYRLMQAVLMDNKKRKSPLTILPLQLRVTTLVTMNTEVSSCPSSFAQNKKRKLNNCLLVDDDQER